jgi:hypothetical protein
MLHQRGEDRGDARRPTWLAGLVRRHAAGRGRDAGTGRRTPAPQRDQRQSRARQPASGDLSPSRHLARFSEPERDRLRFLRWLYERGHLTEFPQHH